MTHTDSDATPPLTRIAARQLALVGRLGMRDLLLFLLLLGGLLLLGATIWFPDPQGAVSGFRLYLIAVLTPVLVLIALFAVIWGVTAWKKEGPDRRVYHNAMPVKRSVHNLLRVAGGAAWLMALVLALLTTAHVGLLAAGREMDVTIPASTWILLLLGLLVLYLISSSVATVARRPAVWLLGVPLGLGVLQVISAASERGKWLERLIGELFEGRFGFLTAVFQPHGQVSALAIGSPAPEPAWASLLLWLAIALAGAVLASWVHREAS